MTALDLNILDFIQAHMRCGFLDGFFTLITYLGDLGIIWIILTVALLCFKKTRSLGFAVALALIFELAVVNVAIKPIFARIRPYDLNTAVKLIIDKPTGYSFPSGHASSSFAAVAALFYGRSRLRWPALVLAVAISFSRLYLYVHYPSDVVFGALIGCVFGILGAFVAGVIVKKLPKKQ